MRTNAHNSASWTSWIHTNAFSTDFPLDTCAMCMEVPSMLSLTPCLSTAHTRTLCISDKQLLICRLYYVLIFKSTPVIANYSTHLSRPASSTSWYNVQCAFFHSHSGETITIDNPLEASFFLLCKKKPALFIPLYEIEWRNSSPLTHALELPPGIDVALHAAQPKAVLLFLIYFIFISDRRHLHYAICHFRRNANLVNFSILPYLLLLLEIR